MKLFPKPNCRVFALPLLLIVLTEITTFRAVAQSMGISNTSFTPDASSILEIRSTTRGILIPRMTTAERDAISSPATGLLVFNNTTGDFNYFDGTEWISLDADNNDLTSVTGTMNRISVGGTANDPTIDISPTYQGQSSITTLGTVEAGTWNGSVISPAYGGTGVNNGTNTITLGGNLTTSGVFATTIRNTAVTDITLPVTGTLSTLSGAETLTNKTLTAPVLTTPILGVASATSHAITGTGGAGFLELQSQSAASTTGPANAIRLFSHTGKLSWKRSDGFTRSFASILTADRTYTLPDANGTIAVSASGNIALSSAGNISFTGILPVGNGGTNSAAALNNNRIMVSATGAITEAEALSNGQLLIGSTGTAPVAANLTAGVGIAITNSAGNITINNEPPISQVTGTSTLTTTSTSDIPLGTPLTVTPGAGDYLVNFTGLVSNSNAGKAVIVSIYVNDTKIPVSEMWGSSGASNDKVTVTTHAYVTGVEAGQAIEIRWRTESNTAKISNRTLIVQRVK